LVNTGFTVGVEDIIARKDILEKVSKEIEENKKKVNDIIK